MNIYLTFTDGTTEKINSLTGVRPKADGMTVTYFDSNGEAYLARVTKIEYK